MEIPVEEIIKTQHPLVGAFTSVFDKLLTNRLISRKTIMVFAGLSAIVKILMLGLPFKETIAGIVGSVLVAGLGIIVQAGLDKNGQNNRNTD